MEEGYYYIKGTIGTFSGYLATTLPSSTYGFLPNINTISKQIWYVKLISNNNIQLAGLNYPLSIRSNVNSKNFLSIKDTSGVYPPPPDAHELGLGPNPELRMKVLTFTIGYIQNTKTFKMAPYIANFPAYIGALVVDPRYAILQWSLQNPSQDVIFELEKFTGKIYNTEELTQGLFKPVPTDSPQYAQCNFGSNQANACFFNHNEANPTKPIIPGIYDPNAVIGFALFDKENSNKSFWTNSLSDEQVAYLNPPSNFGGTNNMQQAYYTDSKCTQPFANDPTICAKNSPPYCKCDADPTKVCGLSCAEGDGYVPSAVPNGCFPVTDVHGIYVQSFQCMKQQYIGIEENGIKKCITCTRNCENYPRFSSLKDCYEQYADCPPGFARGNYPKPGCYLQETFKRNWSGGSGCNAPHNNSCGYIAPTDGDMNKWGGRYSKNMWGAHCHGLSHGLGDSCKCGCAYTGDIPPWGYYCHDKGAYKWKQNQSDQTIKSPCKYGHIGDCGSSNYINLGDSYCSPKSGYHKQN